MERTTSISTHQSPNSIISICSEVVQQVEVMEHRRGHDFKVGEQKLNAF